MPMLAITTGVTRRSCFHEACHRKRLLSSTTMLFFSSSSIIPGLFSYGHRFRVDNGCQSSVFLFLNLYETPHSAFQYHCEEFVLLFGKKERMHAQSAYPIEAYVETTNWLSCVARDRICDSNRPREFPLCKLFQLSFKKCFSIILYISHRISANARYRGTVSLKLPAFVPSTSTFTFSHR
ncbi:hypothetical protein VTN00DRAFT_1124 [Thermoascus crustaceus]|uniref:uncharacterized protein n=1 Tax=Thermoascus crustaceus TaxID=5088 RepID=UPI0037447C47